VGKPCPFPALSKVSALHKARSLVEVGLLVSRAMTGRSPSCSVSAGPHFSRESLLDDRVHLVASRYTVRSGAYQHCAQKTEKARIKTGLDLVYILEYMK
jgi:hypothetical protein